MEIYTKAYHKKLKFEQGLYFVLYSRYVFEQELLLEVIYGISVPLNYHWLYFTISVCVSQTKNFINIQHFHLKTHCISCVHYRHGNENIPPQNVLSQKRLPFDKSQMLLLSTSILFTLGSIKVKLFQFGNHLTCCAYNNGFWPFVWTFYGGNSC